MTASRGVASPVAALSTGATQGNSAAQAKTAAQTTGDASRTLPCGWYPLLPSCELRRRQVRKVTLSGVDLAVFRTADGRAHALHARCVHLGADLGRGDVVGSALRCPLHHRCYLGTGTCAQASAPAQKALQTCEQHGMIFAGLGVSAERPLPEPDLPGPLLRTGVTAMAIACPASLIAANAFDTDHLLAVHGRQLVAPATVRAHDAAHCSISLRAAVAGSGLRDRLLRAIGFAEAEIDIHAHAGHLLHFHHRKVGIVTVLALRPLHEHATLAYAISLRRDPGPWRRPLARLGLGLAHRAILAFAAQDARALAGARLGPVHLHPQRDAALGAYLAHQADLPRCAWPDAADLLPP